MSEIFWESVQKARKEHFCDYCANWIQPGMTYARHIWAPRGNFHIMRRHDDPDCPPNIGEEHMNEMMCEEREAIGVPVILVGEVRQIVKTLVDGTTIIESETHFVPKLVCEAVSAEAYDVDDDGDEEIPF